MWNLVFSKRQQCMQQPFHIFFFLHFITSFVQWQCQSLMSNAFAMVSTTFSAICTEQYIIDFGRYHQLLPCAQQLWRHCSQRGGRCQTSWMWPRGSVSCVHHTLDCLLACARCLHHPNFQEFRLAYWSGSTQKKNEKKCKNIRIWSQKVFCTSNMFRKFSALVYQFLKKIFQYFFKKRREYFFWNQTKYKGP